MILLQQRGHDLVRLGLGKQGTDRNGVAASLVQQHGGGVAEKPLGAEFFGPADDEWGALAIVRGEVGIDRQQPTPASIRTGEGSGLMQGLDESLFQAVAFGQVGLEGVAGGCVTEGEEAAYDGGERGRRGGHEQEQIEQIGDGNRLTDRLPGQGVLQDGAGVLMQNRGRDGRMNLAHGSLQFNRRNN